MSESPNHRNTLFHFAGTDDVVRVGPMSDGESFFQRMLRGVAPWQSFSERVAVNLNNVTYIEEEEMRFDGNN